MDITELLSFCLRNNASDLHLSTGNPPILRVHGSMLPMKSDPLIGSTVKELLYSIMTENQRTEYERHNELDFAISFGDNMRFRINAFTTFHGPAAVFRNIPTEILTLKQINAPAILEKLTDLHKGMVLVTGPTGSGKSTTLAAMINHINEQQSKHILTIEDPIEFVHPSKKSLVNQREVGPHTQSFARALKSALREDPDVILVGELRDLETIQLAITAAETGHLVMGTLHTNSAAKTIDRIIDVFPAADKEMIRSMLSVSLEAVISQALIPTCDGKGRVASHEILLGTSAVRNLIREGKIPQIQSLMQTGTKMGMCTMKSSVYELLEAGRIDQKAARAVLASSGDKEDKEDSTFSSRSNYQQASGGF